MARTSRLSPRFLAHRSALGVVPRSAEARAVAATIVALCAAETLPEPGYGTTLPEPNDLARGVAIQVHVRRVPGRNLWLWYREARTVDTLELVDLPASRRAPELRDQHPRRRHHARQIAMGRCPGQDVYVTR